MVKDVSRALPPAGNSTTNTMQDNIVTEVVKKTLLALSSSSSYVEKNYPFLLPDNSTVSTSSTRSIYDELSTPQDELQKVSENIRAIFLGNNAGGSSSSSSSSMTSFNTNNYNNNNRNERRSLLRSIAPAGTARNTERQKLAFQRRKETILKREKEGLDKKAIRAASSVTDAAWEIKREMQVEGNEAGYRSEVAVKQLKASIAGSALLEGSKNWIGKRLMSGSKEKNRGKPQLEGSGSTSTGPLQLESSASTAVPADGAIQQNANTPPITPVATETMSYSDAVIIEPEPEFTEPAFPTESAFTSTLDTGSTSTQNNAQPTFTNSEQPSFNTAERTFNTETAFATADSSYTEPSQRTMNNPFGASSTTNTNVNVDTFMNEVTENELNEERRRLISILQSCLERPDQTWLQADLLANTDFGNDATINAETNIEEKEEPYYLSQRPMTDALKPKKKTTKPFFASAKDMMEDDDLWEKVITVMVSYKSELEVSHELKDIGTMTKDEIAAELYGMQKLVESIIESVDAAAGKDSADYLRNELLGETQMNVSTRSSDSAQKDHPTVTETVEMNIEDAVVKDVTPTNFVSNTMESEPINVNVVEDANPYNYGVSEPLETVVVAEVSENDELPQRETTAATVTEPILADVEFEVSKIDEISTPIDSEWDDAVVMTAEVELLVDDEEVENMQQTQNMNSAAVSDEEVRSAEVEENPLVTLSLRTLDVLFFVTEKTLTVSVIGVFYKALPSMIQIV